MKSKIYGNKEIIYPEINSAKHKELYDKYMDYRNSKKIKIITLISDILYMLLNVIYYIGIYGTIFYCFSSTIYNWIQIGDLPSFIKAFSLSTVFCIFIEIVRQFSMNYCMADFFREIIDSIFNINIMEELHYCLNKNLEASEGIDKLRNSKQENIKCISIKDNRGLLVFKVDEEILNIKNKSFFESSIDEKGNIDYSYLDEAYLECIEMFKKLNKKIEF